MTISGMVLALLFVSLLVIGMSNFMISYSESNNHNVENLSELNYASQIKEVTNNLASKLNASRPTKGTLLDIPYVVGVSGLAVLKLAFGALPDLYVGLINEVGAKLGIPSVYVGIFVTIVMVVIVFLVASAFLKWVL